MISCNCKGNSLQFDWSKRTKEKEEKRMNPLDKSNEKPRLSPDILT